MLASLGVLVDAGHGGGGGMLGGGGGKHGGGGSGLEALLAAGILAKILRKKGHGHHHKHHEHHEHHEHHGHGHEGRSPYGGMMYPMPVAYGFGHMPSGY